MDAMPTGGRLVARLYETDGHLHAEIEDTGLGIPTTIRDKVFEPFFTTKHSGKGTGLGLSLCRRIIAHHNGIIDFESQEDRGTKFVVKLPKIILQSALLAQQIDLRPSIQELDYDES
jgi:signal transduction histidine kinase